MLIINNDPLSLLKFHLIKNNNDSKFIKSLYIDNIKNLESILLEALSYNEEGDLCLTKYIIEYDCKDVLPFTFLQDKNNEVYLNIQNKDTFNKFCNLSTIDILKIDPLIYQNNIKAISSILELNAWPYFWSEYCIKKFKCNPYKWNNEVKLLMFLYKENNNKKFSKQDLDLIYSKVTNNSKDYLFNMFGDNSKRYLSKLNLNELFILFIRGEKYESELYKYIAIYKPDLVIPYSYLKTSFYKGNIRLQEAVFIFDYIVHNYNGLSLIDFTNLFKLNI